MKNETTSTIIASEVLAILTSFGYKARVTAEEDNFIEIGFPCKDGYEIFKNRHKDAIIALTKGYLIELYAGGSWYYVRIRNKCNGLDPDDLRYDTLIHKLFHLPIDEPVITYPGVEMFINQGDHYDRVIKHPDSYDYVAE